MKVKRKDSSAVLIDELFVAFGSDVVWLEPVVDLGCEFVFDSLSFHLSFVLEEFHDEDFCEALLEPVVHIPVRRSVISKVYLGASLGRTVLAWGLITMAHIHTEHELVSNLVKEGHVLSELLIVRLQVLSQLNLYELIELFCTLSAIRAAIQQAEEHEHGNGASPIIQWCLFLILFRDLLQEDLVEHELTRQ